MDEYEGEWYATDGGDTVGRRGPAEGTIVADAELGDPEEPEDADARLTIEQVGGGFAVTAQLYGGWLFLTRTYPDLPTAEAAANGLRSDLERLAAMIPMEDTRDIPRKVAALNAAIAAVEAAG